jgi:transmembrane sensor
MNSAREIEAQAASWLLRREEPDWHEEDARKLDEWLEESMVHKAAYWRLEYGWLKADRLAALRCSNGEPGITSQNHFLRRWSLAASVLLIIGTASVHWQSQFTRPSDPEITLVSTKAGMRKLVRLQDGSQIDLKSGSAIRTSVDAKSRLVWLDDGEAHFDVTKRDGQQFIVYSGHKKITVLGTRFSVRKNGSEVFVVVREGRVRIEDMSKDSSRQATIIDGGDFALSRGSTTFVAGTTRQTKNSGFSKNSGMLSFDQSTLYEVAAEFNRYNRRKLVIDNPEAGEITIGGTFRTDNVDAFVRLIRDAYGLKIEDNGEIVKISN